MSSKSAHASLKVVDTITIVNGPTDKKAKVKDSVCFPCEVIWDPNFEMTVLWKKDNVDMRVDGSRITVDDMTHTLTMRDLTFADSGKPQN